MENNITDSQLSEIVNDSNKTTAIALGEIVKEAQAQFEKVATLLPVGTNVKWITTNGTYVHGQFDGTNLNTYFFTADYGTTIHLTRNQVLEGLLLGNLVIETEGN